MSQTMTNASLTTLWNMNAPLRASPALAVP